MFFTSLYRFSHGQFGFSDGGIINSGKSKELGWPNSLASHFNTFSMHNH
jgi:hypothetical protein